MIQWMAVEAKRWIPDEDPKFIFEIGSRDARQAIEFTEQFPDAVIYAFECNPETLSKCYENASDHENVHIVPKAVNSFDGHCQFYPIDTERSVTHVSAGNPGASSLFRVRGDFPSEKLVQNEITVRCTRLDSFCSENGISKVDWLWLDLQGAELLALESLGERLNRVKIINTEVEFKEMYLGQPLFEEVDSYLRDRNFILVTRYEESQWFANAIYLNRSLITGHQAIKLVLRRETIHLYKTIRKWASRIRHSILR